MASCGEVLAHMLKAYGIDTAFGIPGTHTIELYRGLPRTGIKHVTPRHEQGAGFMADGYARVSGQPAVCITVSGPGALNIATAMGQALLDSVPMLVISADNATYELGLGEGRLHETANLQQAMRQVSRWSHTLMRPDELPKVLARAFSIFRGERPGPVHISIPQDVITAEASQVSTKTWALPAPPAPAPDAVLEAARMLNRAQAPVVALGGGAARGRDSIAALVENLDAPVTLTHNAKGCLTPGHPLLVRGSPSFQPVRDLYRAADVILAIGTEFSETDYDFFFDGAFNLGEAQLIRVDIDPAQHSRNAPATLAMTADAELAAMALLEHCQRPRADGAERTGAVNKQLEALHHPGYQAFLDCIQEALPGAAVFGDSTQPAYYAAAQYHAPGPHSFASAATGYGTLGYALPAAFGAKLAQRERPVVCLVGDGGLQFTINELATAVEAEIPVAVLVWNNECYDMIAQNFRDAGMEPIACDIYTPDFLKIAEGYGCPASRVTTLEEIKAALRESLQHGVPSLIEVMEADFI
jgi:acetolactate synthase-1/2/3 large subunit